MKKTTQEKIAVMQASLEDNEIERFSIYDYSAKWELADNPSWNWSQFDYRVKPGQESCETKTSTSGVLSGPNDTMAGLRKILGKQVGGKHYQHGKIQAIEYIMANDLPFAEGCVVKRVTRHRYKDGVQDILKAMQELSFIAAHDYGVIVNIETEKEKQAYLDGAPCGKEVTE